ncbi:hypothetical protein BSZ39_07900 [Bowdeniella nasicola]|uniref:DUF4190 domain-containing protein n=1 Tax=Bowdeniella nasicola TaxID=208480 RepID=A0A1Q5Q218_9ACTO|nr:hypothetical protein [Bowdeniella nasicola]OKL53722.1 hypothetical protein BSZ39_07900 [Bowdeniella nasicola]
MSSPSKPENDSPEAAKANADALMSATQPAVATGLLLVLAMVLNTPRAPLWAVIASALTAIAVIPAGIYAIRKLRGVERARLFRFFLIITMAIAGVFALSTIVQLVAFDSTSAYLQCVSTALTEEGRVACERELTNSVLRQLFGN